MRKPLLLASCLALLSCVDEDFNTPDRLYEPRILAMQAEPPQPGFGQPATLRSLIYLPTRVDRSVDCSKVENPGPQYHWSWCPMASTNANGYACPFSQADLDQLFATMGLGAAPSLDLGTGETATFVNPFPAEVLHALCIGEQSSYISCNMPAESDPNPKEPISYPITVTLEYTPPCGTPKRETFPAMMTSVFTIHLPVDDSAPRNQNPVLGDLFRIDNLPDGGAEPAPLPVTLDAGEAIDADKAIDAGVTLDAGEAIDAGSPAVNEDASAPAADAPIAMPTFEGIRLDEAASVTLPRERRVKLRLQLPMASSESLPRVWKLDQVQYDESNPGNSKILYRERLSLSWFAEAGDFGGDHGNTGGRQTGYKPVYNQREVTQADDAELAKAYLQLWTLPAAEGYKKDTARITVVMRDSRGGVTWTSAVVKAGDKQ
jgi:hypothetical protein